MCETLIVDPAERWFGRSAASLSASERLVLSAATQRNLVSRDINKAFTGKLTLGQRLADKVAEFGGSWSFIIAFVLALALWAGLNTVLLDRPFDAYPFIFLNLLLSMLAAVQAPIIMMSQNRHAAKDRLDAAHDYEINLKAEIEIMALHDKLDQLRSGQIAALLARQEQQIELLTGLLREGRSLGPEPAADGLLATREPQ